MFNELNCVTHVSWPMGVTLLSGGECTLKTMILFILSDTEAGTPQCHSNKIRACISWELSGMFVTIFFRNFVAFFLCQPLSICFAPHKLVSPNFPHPISHKFATRLKIWSLFDKSKRIDVDKGEVTIHSLSFECWSSIVYEIISRISITVLRGQQFRHWIRVGVLIEPSHKPSPNDQKLPSFKRGGNIPTQSNSQILVFGIFLGSFQFEAVVPQPCTFHADLHLSTLVQFKNPIVDI
jgi:hypothetical protein